MLDTQWILGRVRQKRPLVHHITNWVTIYDCANITRAFGALPVMAHAKEEVEQMVGLADCLVLNIGTLTPELVDTMILAATVANKKGAPVILDAVGAGATDLRTDSCHRILKNANVDVLKGNYGEIGTLSGAKAEVKGVESIGLKGEPREIAKTLAKRLGNTVVMTGKRDIVSSPGITYLIDNGTAEMGSIVGTGCMATSVIGAFSAVERDYALACAEALTCFGIIGELACVGACGPGSYKTAFFDAVGKLDQSIVRSMAKVKVEGGR